jgi:chaperonin cofactor prefoldin
MEEKYTGTQIELKYKQNLEKLNSLKSELAKLISDRDYLENTIKKNLEALYVTRIGKNEYELFNLECQLARLKRKIELIQIRINHGKNVNLFEVEKQLDDEYSKWQKKIYGMLSNIKASEARLNSLMSEKETREFQSLYRSLVKKLHPDVNANQSEKEALLWDRTQIAYKLGDIEELQTIKLLLEGIGEEDIKKDSGSISLIDRQIEALKEKISRLTRYIKELKSEFPFTIENNIKDESWVKEKNSLVLARIESIKIQIKEMQSVIENILLANLASIDKDNKKTIN